MRLAFWLVERLRIAIHGGLKGGVPQEFLHAIGKTSIVDVKLGEQVQMEMAILFGDIRSFTALSEKMTPEQRKQMEEMMQRQQPK